MKDTLRIESSVFKNQPYIALQEKEKIFKRRILFPEENESDFDWKQNYLSHLWQASKRPDGQIIKLFRKTKYKI
jgi:hypothetical protein